MQTTATAEPITAKPRVNRSRWRWVRRGLLGLLALLLLAVCVSALSNLFLPAGPARTDRLDPLDKARLSEALHLKATLGDNIWPGFAAVDIPVIVWNQDYSFLVGVAARPDGWEPVPGDTFADAPYYRRLSHDPQNFAVQVGDRWAASIATKWETDSFLRGKFQEALPPGLAQVFPYRLLIGDSEVQIGATLHEAFHAYQEEVAPAHLAAAERVYPTDRAYAQADAAMGGEWQNEIALLTRAVRAPSTEEATTWARRFLAARQARRAQHALDPSLIAYERGYEWLEGSAKYVELSGWRLAHTADGYTPTPQIAADPDFKGYGSFDNHWGQELDQMGRQATADADVRLYYTGMAQGVLLDRLGVEWKPRVMGEGAQVEELLAAAVNPSSGR